MKNKLSFFIILALLISLVIVLASCGETNEPEHVHTMMVCEKVEPTCTETGLTEGKKCNECGEILLAQEIIPALGHTEETLPAVVPTCTEEGLTEGKKCSVCGATTLAQETIDALGHTEEIIASIAPTCTDTGLTEGKKCSACNEILVKQETVDALGHTYKNSYICNVCKQVSAIESVGLEFELNTETDTYIVTGIGACTDIDIVIPYTYNKKAVTAIKDSALYNHHSLTSITIPSSVTSIGEQAFYGCSALTSVTIGNSVTSIGRYAFLGCIRLTSVNYLGTIENWCNISFSDSYATPLYYGAKLYLNGELVTELTIPSTVTEIKDYAFYDYDSLTSVTIPDSVTSIGSYAFESCDSLTSITIGNSVTSIGEDAFLGCSSLTIYCEATSKPSGWSSSWKYSNSPVVWDCKNNIVASDGYTYTVIDGIRYGTKDNTATVVEQPKNIVEANIPSSITYNGVVYPVTSIGNSAFSGCTSLTSVTIPDSVTNIGNYAFAYCYSLTSVTIPDSVTSIGDYAFSDCDSLTSVTIGNSVTSIGYDAFNGCTSLTSVNYLGTIENWCNISFSDSSANPLCCGAKLYLNGELVTELTIPSTVTEIKDSAFYNCKSLTGVTIPDSVKSIGGSAFRYCDSLTSVTIGNSVTSIDDYAFYDCDSLTIYCEATSKPSGWWNYSNCPVVWDCKNNTVASDGYIYTVIDGIRYGIKDNTATVVRQPSSIVEANIPSSITYNGVVYPVTNIGNSAFSGCSSLTSIIVDEKNTEYKSIDGNLYTKDGKTLVQYAIGKQDLYFVVPNDVTSIGSYAFSGCDSLTSVTIGNSVTSIGEDAFASCNSLTSVNYLGTIANWCNISFSNSYANPLCCGAKLYLNGELVTELTIPSTVTEIKDFAFYSCDMTSVTIPDSLTSIGSYAFYSCSSLTSVTIGDGVTSIGDYAFAYCDSLTSVTIPDGVTSIGDYAFRYCYSLIIYCETTSTPSGWSSSWNYSSIRVVWGHTHSYTDGKCICGMKEN